MLKCPNKLFMINLGINVIMCKRLFKPKYYYIGGRAYMGKKIKCNSTPRGRKSRDKEGGKKSKVMQLYTPLKFSPIIQVHARDCSLFSLVVRVCILLSTGQMGRRLPFLARSFRTALTSNCNLDNRSTIV